MDEKAPLSGAGRQLWYARSGHAEVHHITSAFPDQGMSSSSRETLETYTMQKAWNGDYEYKW